MLASTVHSLKDSKNLEKSLCARGKLTQIQVKAKLSCKEEASTQYRKANPLKTETEHK